MSASAHIKTKADQQIEDALRKHESFILDAGAGSGKTSSLVAALRYVIEGPIAKDLAKSGQKVACITFTNVAKQEIIDRTGNSPIVSTSTIHDFLWDILKPHQPALRRALLAHNAALKPDSKRKRDATTLEAALLNVRVLYQDRGTEFLEGRIFHDDLLEVARHMFKDSPLLGKIAAAKFPIIFVDEYQDTNIAVVEALLQSVLPQNKGQVVIGFFGDKVQSIYDGGVGEIPKPLQTHLISIPKEENYRCSLAVIDLLNNIRSDIKQRPAGDNKPGSAVFIRLNPAKGDVLGQAREFVRKKLEWDLSKGTQRDLFLTHALIARRAGYDSLLEAYKDRGAFTREQMLKGEDPTIKFFHTIVVPLTAAWRDANTGLVLKIIRENGFALSDVKGKSRARTALDDLAKLTDTASVGEVLTHLRTTGLVKLPDVLGDALDTKPPKAPETMTPEALERRAADQKFFAGVFALEYKQISSFCLFLDEHTPFSTQHGVKGAEFDTVFVVLDDKGARWHSAYSFDKYLSGEDEAGDKQRRAQNSRNLFYVCCSRSRNNLAVIDLGAADAKKDARIKQMFGDKNCYF